MTPAAPPGDAPARDGQSRLAISVILLAAIALWIVMAVIAARNTARGNARANVPHVARVVPPPPGPIPVAPMPLVLDDIAPDDARASNAALPIAVTTVTPAPPFVWRGSAQDRAAATACLAAAVLYEAGDDAVGEAAVAQVVLNRVRHPAFPKSICGVVFQGSERSTGCQFTFTCDGAMARRVSPEAWRRASDIATRAIGGAVVRTVGTATHYHADWVVPYWRASLEKLAEVHTHIFYRWPGRWGTGAVFAGGAQEPERIDPRVAAIAGLRYDMGGLPDAPGLSAPDPATLAPRVSLAIDGVPRSALKGSIVRLADADGGQFILQLDPGTFPGGWAIVGYTICGPRPNCIVMGWTNETETPRSFPILPNATRSMAFMYRKSSMLGIAQPAWDCRRFPRHDRAQCLAGTGG